VHFINTNYKAITRLISLPELLGHKKTRIGKSHNMPIMSRQSIDIIFTTKQASVILPLLTRFGITQNNLSYFVLNNATNNNTILNELAKVLDFKVEEKKLRCIGHILNFIAKAYLFGQDAKSWEGDFKGASILTR